MPGSDKNRTMAYHPLSHSYVLSPESRLWMKKYRTEVAACSSSLLSTLLAVSSSVGRLGDTLLTSLAVPIGFCQDSDASVRTAEIWIAKPLTHEQIQIPDVRRLRATHIQDRTHSWLLARWAPCHCISPSLVAERNT